MRTQAQWRDVVGDEAAELQAELERELCPDHPLYGLDGTPWRVARTGKDAAFLLSDGGVALVHLAFNRETSPAYPFFKVFASKAEALPRLALLANGKAYE